MDDVNVPVFAQAKLEYTKQLVDLLYSHFNDGITLFMMKVRSFIQTEPEHLF